MKPNAFYHQVIQQKQRELDRETTTLNLLSWSRLVVVICIGTCIWFATQGEGRILYSILAFLLSIGFLWLVRSYHIKKTHSEFLKQVIITSERELAAFDLQRYPWEDGERYNTAEHPFANDLDIVGAHSLFQFINRTHAVRGEQKLAAALLYPELDRTAIEERQEAIKELSLDRTWTLEFEADSELGKDHVEISEFIQRWEPIPPVSIGYRILTWILTAIGACSMLALIVTGDIRWFSFGTSVFAVNLVVFGMVAKRIFQELGQMDRTYLTLASYARLLKRIESASWNSTRLKRIQESLIVSDGTASEKLDTLSRIYTNLESVRNGFAMIHFNGTMFYHVHQFHRLIQWRKRHGEQLNTWIDAIGAVEELLSFSVFAYNHPNYVYPEINENYRIQFDELVHPLLAEGKCVANSIDFSQRGFVILTGSNMSGKSTFLRSLGIGLTLSYAGSVVPARNSLVHPMPVLASMRLKDSLADSTSYFFAEIKRLQFIMETAREQRCFVLLDELLRGTNSDDKIAGTIAIVDELASLQAMGIIATHDLEVCETESKHPNYLKNKCFEATIERDELLFDYTLREGICKNRSASFLLEKYAVITPKSKG